MTFDRTYKKCAKCEFGDKSIEGTCKYGMTPRHPNCLKGKEKKKNGRYSV